MRLSKYTLCLLVTLQFTVLHIDTKMTILTITIGDLDNSRLTSAVMLQSSDWHAVSSHHSIQQKQTKVDIRSYKSSACDRTAASSSSSSAMSATASLMRSYPSKNARVASARHDHLVSDRFFGINSGVTDDET